MGTIFTTYFNNPLIQYAHIKHTNTHMHALVPTPLSFVYFKNHT